MWEVSRTHRASTSLWDTRSKNHGSMTGGIECPCFLVLMVVILSRLDHDPDICSVRVPVAGSRKRNKKQIFILLGHNKTLNLQWQCNHVLHKHFLLWQSIWIQKQT